MKQLLVVIAGFSLGILIAAAAAMTGTVPAQHAAKAPSHATVMIRHQTRGCHSWSVNGGPYRAAQRTTLARGGTITFINNDVMPQKLIKTSGPAARYQGNRAMRHMSASGRVIFTKAGIYRFTTKVGEDYMPGVKTIGEDNVLKLTVTVS